MGLTDVCLICDTELVHCGDAGWRHGIGFKERGGCQSPIPSFGATVDVYREHGDVGVD